MGLEENSVFNVLRPYQAEVVQAIIDSVFAGKGLTFCVEIARQGGKNELSARLEAWLLMVYSSCSANIIKCSPTFKPQIIVSMTRLKDRLNDLGMGEYWVSEVGYIIRYKNARAIFLSAGESSSVVGHTANLLLEVDEAQDVSKEKYTKDFRPMGSTSNVTTVLYGTTWDDTNLLEETKQACGELEKKDGVKRCFHYDWQEVAKYNPGYLAYVESERERLGENHPLFLTQYCLQPIHGGGKFLSSLRKAQLQGNHPRRKYPEAGKLYIAGIDLAGEAEEDETGKLQSVEIRRDATIVTIGELDFSDCDTLRKQPTIRIMEHYRWTGRKHTTLYGQLSDIIKNVWNCRRVVVDSTGVGQPMASFLRQSIGSRIVPFHFTGQSKSALGFNLLAGIDSGQLKMYTSDGSEDYRDFWLEMERARVAYRPNKTMNFFVDATDGHDDFLMSLALLAEAADGYLPRSAKGKAKATGRADSFRIE